jgi:hypothetical protein
VERCKTIAHSLSRPYPAQELYLKVADLISLNVQIENPNGEKQGGYLVAKGILDSDCFLTCDTTQPFDDCVFKICVKTRVSASNELKV